jgi:periplasmic protein TonB
MRVGRDVRAVICVVIALANAHLAPAQEATSANLPDQFQTGEMIQIQKPKKKKKAESDSQTVATTTKQDAALVPEQMPAVEEVPTPIAPAEEKKAEPKHSSASMPPNQKPSTSIEQTSSGEEPAVAAVPSERKFRPRKRQRPVLQPEPVSVSAPVSMSLSVAQSMAITAPLPEYTYEMKRRNLTGSGICVVTVDSATGTVTNANMSQSTGNPLLDKHTIQTFKGWRFKPGTVSQVRVPVSYE